MHYHIVIVSGQSNANGVISVSSAPAGVFTGNVLNDVSVWDGTAIIPLDVTDIGPTGNGHTWVGAGSSSSGNYCWPHLVMNHLGQSVNVLAVIVTEGGSSLMKRTIANGSHNTDTATLSGTYPTTPRLHEELVDRYNDCITYLGNNSHTYEAALLLWDQGEADAAQNYPTRLTDLTAKFAAIRTLTGNASLPIYYTTRPDTTFHREWMDRTDLDLDGGNNHCLKLYNGTTSDGVHFDAPTILYIGNYFSAIYSGNASAPNKGFYCRPAGNDFDPVSEFTTATGISGAAVTACQDLIDGLTSAGIIDKFVRIFPLVGTNASAHQYNLLNPNFGNTTIVNGTSDSTGWKPNGSSAYIETNLILTDVESMGLEDFGIDVLVTEDNIASSECAWSCNGSTGEFARLFVPFGSTLRFDVKTAGFNLNYAITSSLGLFSGQVRSGQAEIYINGSRVNNKAFADTGNFVNNPIGIGVDRPGGNVRWFSKKMGFIAIRKSLSEAEMATYYGLINDFKTTLSR